MATFSASPVNGSGLVPRPSRICTYCGSDEIYRQRPRGLIERHVFKAFHFTPYWCAACDKRFYLRPVKPSVVPSP
jgi:DNA-directed RNA polymerase subunit RPC12/RpoP